MVGIGEIRRLHGRFHGDSVLGDLLWSRCEVIQVRLTLGMKAFNIVF